MKYLLIISLLFSGLFAHTGDTQHLHFFSSLHLEGLILFLGGLIATYFIYEKVLKRDS